MNFPNHFFLSHIFENVIVNICIKFDLAYNKNTHLVFYSRYCAITESERTRLRIVKIAREKTVQNSNRDSNV